MGSEAAAATRLDAEAGRNAATSRDVEGLVSGSHVITAVTSLIVTSPRKKLMQ